MDMMLINEKNFMKTMLNSCINKNKIFILYVII